MKTICLSRAVTPLVSLLLFFTAPAALDAQIQGLHGHVPAFAKFLQPLGNFSGTNHLKLAIGLPLRNREALTNLLQQIYDPTSPNYRHYLTPEQFAQRFGPTEQDYRAVMDFAVAHGLTVVGTHPNRTLVDVSGSVADIEKAFHVNLRVYPHPTEARTFYAPDIEPSVDLAVPILEVSGLDDYVLPKPMYHQLPVTSAQGSVGTPAAGTGPDGTYMGSDFRSAYVPGVTLTGSGQTVALFQLDGYYTNDPVLYANQAGLTNVIMPTNVLVDGFDGTPGYNNVEVALDIEMVMAMAPGAQIIVYEGSNTVPTIVIDLLNRIATDNLAQEISASWGYHTGPAMDQIYQQMAAQGQSFFNSSGDLGAYSGTVRTPADDPYITIVGGTILTTGGAGNNWVSETAWNWGGGGTSTVLPIPVWQQGVAMSTNGGSTTMRNLPDVAMVANSVYAVANNGAPLYLAGTSISAPLWAAFTALVNQKAALQGKPTVGFVNLALYAIGKGTNYSAAFHDITTGNNTNSSSPDKFFAVPGYDLCTGWGSPTPNLIDALLNVQFIFPNGWTLTILPDEDWICVASSADGTKLAAVATPGAHQITHQINISSSSGATWRSYGPVADWRGLASSADGIKLAAAAYNGPIYVSTNSGVDWVATAAPAYSWNSLACSADGSKLAARAQWEGLVGVSTNFGTTWSTAGRAPGYTFLTPVAWSGDGNVLVTTYGNQVYVSTNWGISATTNTIPNSVNDTQSVIQGVTASTDGSTLVAVGLTSICLSTNRGASWVVTSAPSKFWFAVACSADGYRIVAADYGYGVYLSDDRGATWINIGPKDDRWHSIACSANGDKLTLAANGYSVYTGVFPRSGPVITTPPTGSAVSSGSNAAFSVVAFGPPPTSYQWRFNGTNIVDETNCLLVLTNVQWNQAGNYAVAVSNTFGVVVSTNAALLVQVTNRPVFSSAVVLSTGVVQSTVTGAVGPIAIEASTNLITWITLTNIIVTNGDVQFIDSSATNCPQRFYRVRNQ